VYDRHLPELREIGSGTNITGVSRGRPWAAVDEQLPRERAVRIEELAEDRVEEWTDGSRVDGRATGAARTEAQYLGSMATVGDAEVLGVGMAWETSDTVALDSLG